MKKLFSLSMLALVALFFGACSSVSTPSDVAEQYAKCVINEDAEGISELFYYDSADAEKAAKDKSMVVSLFKEKVQPEFAKKGGVASYEIKSETIAEAGDEAVVEMVFTFKDGTTDDQKAEFVLINEKWYMDLGK